MSNDHAATLDETFPLADATDHAPDPTPAPENPVSTATADPPAAANGKAPKAPKVKAANKAKKKAVKAKAAAGANGKPAPKAKPEKAPKAEKPLKTTRPPGKVVTLPTKELVLDRRLQTRSTMFDEETVEQYKELHLDNPETLPPVDVVDIGEEEAAELGLASRYVVWDGFQRTEARRRAKLAEMKCNVTQGTFERARFWALGANSGHGLKRSPADIRKAVQLFLGDDVLKAAVLAGVKLGGGANRAISAALGISKASVSKYLNALGYTTKGEKVVKLAKRDDPESPAPHQRTEGDPAGGLRVESKDAIKSRLTGAIVKEMAFAAAQLQRRYESLLERDDIKALFREVATKNGVPVARDENPGDKRVVVTEYWPAADTLLKCLEELNEAFAKMNTATSK